MRGQRSIEEFAALTRMPIEDIERFRRAGLLDPDEMGAFNDYDVLRLQFVQGSLAEGQTVDEIAAALKRGEMAIPIVGDLLYPPPGEMLTRQEAAERLGLTVDQMGEISTAIGLPMSGRVDPNDLEALAGATTVMAAGFSFEALLEACRVFGDGFRRMAQTEVRLMHDYVHERLAAEGMSEREITNVTGQAMETMEPVLGPLLLFLHKQFLLRSIVEDVLLHMERGRADGRTTIEATIVFVDLSAFTPLAQVHGDEEAARVLQRFDDFVRRLVLDHNGTLVKQIGDEFMLTFREPADAVRFAIQLDSDVKTEDRFPAMRIGMHAGPVLYRVGDYVGNTPNIASRVAAAAGPNEIVVTEAVATAARAAGITVEPAGIRMLRGTSDPIPLFRVAREAARPSRDPVCGMIVTAGGLRLERDGVEQVFCSEDCLRRFVTEPDRYAAV